MEIEIERCEEDYCDKIIHRVKEPQTDPIEVNAFAIRQKGKDIVFCGIPAKELDLMCDVPSINFREWSNIDIAEKAISPIKGSDFNWQRELSFSRIEEISDFFDEDTNYIVNPVVIALKDSDAFSGIQNNLRSSPLTVRIEPWMKNSCPECGMDFKDDDGKTIYQDRCSDHECSRHNTSWQPAIVIDGQHRIRGIPYRHSHYREEFVPTIILPPNEFGKSEQAKLFTEITTKSEDLHKLHKMLLQYAFNISPLDETNNMDRRWAYEICLFLNAFGNIESNPVWDKIRVAPHKKGFIDALQAVSVLKDYYSGCLEEHRNAPGRAAEIIKDYLSAVKQTWPYAWERSPQHGWLNHKGVFKVLLELFETIHERVNRYRGGRYTVQNFKEELSYGKSISWGEDPSWDKFISPDKNLRILSNILKDRFDPLEVEPDFSDINEYIKKKPQNPNVHIPDGALQDGIRIRWGSPINAYSTPDIRLIQSNETRVVDISSAVARKGEIELVEGTHFIENGNEAKIEIDFRNHTPNITTIEEIRSTLEKQQ